MFTSHLLDGLYPEWDEFYLLVCDICGIIIRPQALDKHLATKHRINVQPPTPEQQTKQPRTNHHTNNNHNNSNSNHHHNNHDNNRSLPNNSHHHSNNSNSKSNNTNTTNDCNNCVVSDKPQNGTTAQPTMISPKLWGGKHALDSPPQPAIKRRSCDWVKVRRAPDTSLLTSSSTSLLSSSPAPLTGETSTKYQDRKWRNTFNVLRDTFF